MKIGDIIEVEGVRYIAQQETLACRDCYFDGKTKIDCYKEFGCKSEDNVIFIAVPAELLRKIEQLEKQNEFLKKKLYDIQQYIEHKKVCGKSVNFSDADLITNEIMDELEDILYWEEWLKWY